MGLRDPNKDKPKSTAQYLKETRVNSTCMLEDCNNPISTFEGPGSQVLCRAHQIECVEYGGMGKPDRPHTFYRNWVCDNCGYDPREDDLRFGHVEDEYDKLRAMRRVMTGDHIHLKSQGGSNAKENIRSLCVLCHMAKSYIDKDYLGNKKL